MARYFFHLRDGIDVLLDDEGREMDDVAAIKAVALNEVRSMIGTDAREGHIRLDQRLDVEDISGAVVYSLAFKDAVRIVQPDRL